VLGGSTDFDPRYVFPVDDLAVTRPLRDPAAGVLRVVSAPVARRVLRGALNRLGGAPSGTGAAGGPELLLADSDSFGGAVGTIVEGIEMALDAIPELAGDLLPHVALFAVVSAESAGTARIGLRAGVSGADPAARNRGARPMSPKLSCTKGRIRSSSTWR